MLVGKASFLKNQLIHREVNILKHIQIHKRHSVHTYLHAISN